MCICEARARPIFHSLQRRNQLAGEQRARQGVRRPFARLGKARRRELPHRRLDVQRVEEAALRICLQGFAPVT